jgi:hypothetical protein
MSGFLKYKFWIGVGAAAVVLLVLYVVVVMPKKTLVKSNVSDLEMNLSKLEKLNDQGSNVANPRKIELAQKASDVLEKQFEKILGSFPDSGDEKVDFWPGVVVGGVVRGSMFKDKYETETRALEQNLTDNGIKIDEDGSPFQWVAFKDDVPSPKECIPVMRDFRLVEHIVGLLLDSGAVRYLDAMSLGTEETVVLTVRDEIAFYNRPFQIKADILYYKVLDLAAGLSNSKLNIIIETILVEQSETPVARQGEDPPVTVTLNCSMLKRGPMPEVPEESY